MKNIKVVGSAVVNLDSSARNRRAEERSALKADRRARLAGAYARVGLPMAAALVRAGVACPNMR